MSLFVKVCGVTDVRTAEVCVESGVDAIGFVFASSPRRVTPDQAASIAASVPGSVRKVAVFRRPRGGDVRRVLEGFHPDVIQADHDTLPEGTGASLLPVYRQNVDDIPEQTRFLYEGPVSGVGEMVDLDLATQIAERGEMILAGGLRPGNVGEAIRRVRPYGVDVSSGVEIEPGLKDPRAIRAFVAAAREAENRLVNT